MNIFVVIFLSLCLANAAIFLSRKTKIPDVITMIIVGMFFGLPIFQHWFLGETKEIIIIIGHYGLFALMFFAGLNSSRRNLVSEEKDSFIITLFSTFFPFLLSFLVFTLLGFDFLTTLIIAVSMSITAEGTNAEILLEMDKLKTKVGSIIIEAGLLDDLFGLFVFLIISFAHHAPLIENIVLIGTVLAFFIGLWAQKIRHHIHFKSGEKIVQHFLIPFFFISIGLSFQFNVLTLHPGLVFSIFMLALIGKVFGTLLAKPFVQLKLSQLHLIGWAMNSRGAVELALALIAFNIGLITQEVYSALVFMALLTTVIFPFILRYLIEKKPHIMEIRHIP